MTLQIADCRLQIGLQIAPQTELQIDSQRSSVRAFQSEI
jgi:hypothetical protein